MTAGKDGGDGKTSPFGNGNGAPASGAASGSHDFATDPKGGGGGDSPRDLLKAFQRPQTEARTEVAPDPSQTPSGGRVLKADPPGSEQKAVGSGSTGVDGAKPFKNLK